MYYKTAFLEKVLEASKEPLFTSKHSYQGHFKLAHLRKPWVAMREAGFQVDAIFVHPAQGFDIRVAPDTLFGFDYKSQAVLLDTGQIGHLWGAKVLEVDDVPEGTWIFVGRKAGKNVTDEFKVGVLQLSQNGLQQ